MKIPLTQISFHYIKEEDIIKSFEHGNETLEELLLKQIPKDTEGIYLTNIIRIKGGVLITLDWSY